MELSPEPDGAVINPAVCIKGYIAYMRRKMCRLEPPVERIDDPPLQQPFLHRTKKLQTLPPVRFPGIFLMVHMEPILFVLPGIRTSHYPGLAVKKQRKERFLIIPYRLLHQD